MIRRIVLLLLSCSFLSDFTLAKDYTQKQEVRRFIERMVHHYRYDRRQLYRLFRNVRFQRSALSIYVPSLRPKRKPVASQTKGKKKLGSWDRYERYFLRQSKVTKGVAFMHRHRRWFRKAYRAYGVEPEYIAAIIGIESHFGANRGKYPVFDTLVTLAFERHRRSRFYKRELEAFLRLCKREKINPKNVKGSRAGAIGLGQFMPSNYEHFVIDFNGDGYHRMNTVPDAVGSIAHYFRRHGWQKGLPVAVRVRYAGKRFTRYKTGYRYRYDRRHLKGIRPRYRFDYRGKVHLVKLQRADYDELWYGTKNFYVITRYNHSDYYAMAVHLLAQKLKRAYIKRYGSLRDVH